MNKKKALALALTLALTLSACGASKSDTPPASDGGSDTSDTNTVTEVGLQQRAVGYGE